MIIINKDNTTVKHIKCRLGLDMIWCRKPMNLCTLANKLQWWIQVPKLVNHWLGPMCVEVGASVSNLAHARRVSHLADVCRQLVHMFIYTSQHMFKHGCISFLACRVVHKMFARKIVHHACELAMPKKGVLTERWCVCGCQHLWKLCWMPLCFD